MNSLKNPIKNLGELSETENLILLIINSVIGIALVHFKSHPINWLQTGLFIIWVVFFYPGMKLLVNSTNRKAINIEYYQTQLIGNKYKLFGAILMGLSIIPFFQIFIASLDNYWVVYLICLVGIWIITNDYFENLIGVFGITEFIDALMISFFIPILVLIINRVQISAIFLPVSLSIFLEFIAFKLIKYLLNNSKKEIQKLEIIGSYTIRRMILIFIYSGYIMGYLLLAIQDRQELAQLLVISIPLAFLLIIKIFQKNIDWIRFIRDIKFLRFIFLFFFEISWIFTLWIL